METATDKTTIRLVLVAIAVITLLLFAAGAACILLDKPDSASVPLFTAGGLGLGGLLATLNNTRSPIQPPPDPAPVLAPPAG